MTNRPVPTDAAPRPARGDGLPDAVLWDMDGTLVDTEPYWIAAEKELVAAYGNEWPDEHAHALIGSDLLTAAAYIAEHGPVPLSPREIVESLLDGVIGRLAQGMTWRPGAVELLAGLRAAGVPCALVTMSWTRFAQPVLDGLPSDSFDAIVTGDTVDRGKPDPEPYLLAARMLGVDPRRCAAVEDSPTGATSAAAAGCRVLAVPMMPPLRIDHEVTILSTLEGVDVDWIRRWWAESSDAAQIPVNNRC